MFKAMFLTAFYGFFRVGELTTKQGIDSSSVVQIRDLVWLVKDSTTVGAKWTLINFKHNTSKRPFYVHIVRQDSDEFCPITTLQKFCSFRGDQPGPLFCTADLASVSTSAFNVQLRQCLNFSGLDSSWYKSHSFRIGAAIVAANKGFSDSQIRTMGRWKSDAFKVYLRFEAITTM